MTREMQRELKRQSMLRDNDHQLAKVTSIRSYVLDRITGEDCEHPLLELDALDEAIEELIARRRILSAPEESN